LLAHPDPKFESGNGFLFCFSSFILTTTFAFRLRLLILPPFAALSSTEAARRRKRLFVISPLSLVAFRSDFWRAERKREREREREKE
jgi:hypothetical protein